MFNEEISAMIADQKKGCTFTSIRNYTKAGKEAGRGDEKKLYGNDTINTVILTGFSYESLVRRSLDLLDTISTADVLKKLTGKTDKNGNAIGAEAVEVAREQIRASYNLTLAGENHATNEDAFNPCFVDGEAVKGAKVYCGENEAIAQGTVYLAGLMINSQVVKKAENGPIPASKSADTVIAKATITAMLPTARYRTFKLVPGKGWSLTLGGCETLDASEDAE